MWAAYREITRQYQKIPLSEERRLIAQAQSGSVESAREIILRHIGFLIFRIHKRAFPVLIKRYGEELLADSILILYKKIETYNLRYRDKQGNPKPVKFVSYIWKRIDGFIIDSLKAKIENEKLERSVDSNGSDMNGYDVA